jgi:hypothetical protein
MPIERNKVWKRRRIVMRVCVQAMLFAVATAGASSTLAQEDSAEAKRKKQYGLESSEYGRGQGQGLRRPDGVPAEKKEKRGNTPPGSDRAGDGPASGAIVDPAGVTTK